MMNIDCVILLASADVCGLYSNQKLDNTDRKRLQQHPELEQRTDWQSSRFLKQQLADPYSIYSLTHKKGHAGLIATSTTQDAIGIDIEYAQKRNFLELAQLFCTENEQAWLVQQADLSTAFYQLWTLKEAFIKVSRGQLADMHRWCLVPQGYNAIHIPAHNPPVKAYSCVIDKNWHISVIYPSSFSISPQCCTSVFGHWQNCQFNWHQWPINPDV